MVNLTILIIHLAFSMVAGNLDVEYEWKYIDYVWKDSNQKQEAIDSGDYNATQIFTIDVDRSRDGRIFLTTPRQKGVPATLSTVSEKFGEGGPLLRPYPNWSWNTQGKGCTGITSVYRVTIECNHLIVLDTGKDGDDQICPVQVLIFNLKTDKLVKRITIPADLAANENGKGLLITPVVQEADCRTFPEFGCKIFMADVEGYGLVVYDRNVVKRYSDPSFEAEERYANFTIEGESFQLRDGLFSLALGPRRHHHEGRYLYYRPLASLMQYSVPANDLGVTRRRAGKPRYKNLGYKFPSQVTVQAFSTKGVLFMGYTNPPAIACWNSKKPMNSSNVNIVAQDKETLQFTSGLKIKGEELWATTNRFQKIMAGTQDFGEVNFRILSASNIRKLVSGTTCS